jgi:hypothetical protein
MTKSLYFGATDNRRVVRATHLIYVGATDKGTLSVLCLHGQAALVRATYVIHVGAVPSRTSCACPCHLCYSRWCHGQSTLSVLCLHGQAALVRATISFPAVPWTRESCPCLSACPDDVQDKCHGHSNRMTPPPGRSEALRISLPVGLVHTVFRPVSLHRLLFYRVPLRRPASVSPAGNAAASFLSSSG